MANTAGYKLRSAAHKHLTDVECATLKICIRRFRETQSVLGLCTALQKFLDTPENVHLLALIFPMISVDLRVDFDNLLRLQFEHYGTIRPKLVEKYKIGSVKKASPKGKERKSSARVLLPVEQLHNIAEAREQTMQTFKGRRSDIQRVGSQQSIELTRVSKDHKRSKTYHAPEQPQGGGSNPERSSNFRQPQPPPPPVVPLNTSHTSSDSTPRVRLGELRQEATPKALKVRRVTLERREGQSFGFCIRGGVDLNSGIYVSEVDPRGQAERKGMRVGERILKVNSIVFKNITHSQAVVAIKSASRINVYLAPLGQMPGSSNSTTPRLGDGGVGSTLGSQLKLPSSDTINTDVPQGGGRKVTILAEEDGWLGFSIRGGRDQDLEVTVASVDPASPADRAGLKKGQRITKVNGAAVDELDHMQIVNLVLAASIVVLYVLPTARKLSQSSAGMSKPRGRHVSSGSSTGSRGLKKEAQTQRLEADSNFTPSRRRRGPKSPIPETDLEIAHFVAEMQSTPPVSTSTPMPPDDEPRLIKNRNQYMREMYNSNATDEATILQMMRDTGEIQPTFNLNLSNLSERTEEVQSTPRSGGSTANEEAKQNKHSRRRSKFDQGTIRLNLANPTDKEVMKETKLINIDIDIENEVPVGPKQRMHVKDLFKQKQETNLRHSPSPVRPEMHHTELPEGYTPRMNILSSPYAHYDRERHIRASELSPSSRDLKRAVGTATSQISNELTGKTKAMTTCNLPPSPHTGSSPVSKFIHKVLRRSSSSGKDLVKGNHVTSPKNNSVSRESLNSGYGSFKFGKAGTEATIGGTAYDLARMGATDLSSTDGD